MARCIKAYKKFGRLHPDDKWANDIYTMDYANVGV